MAKNTVSFMDSIGRIVVPLTVRCAMGWNEKTPIAFSFDAQKGEVTIKRHSFCCIFCGSREDLSEYRRQWICRECREELRIP